MADFTQACEFMLKNEGGLVDDNKDPGGITNFGISYRFLKSIDANATQEDIVTLSRDNAIKIYKDNFWDNQKYKDINHQTIANYVFDMAVNMGAANAHKVIQRAIWSCRRERTLKDDGVLGPITLGAINNNSYYLLPPLMAERASYYRVLITQNSDLKCFMNGWLDRCYRI